jgi:hypothetical protein
VKFFYSVKGLIAPKSGKILDNDETIQTINTIDPSLIGKARYSFLAVEIGRLHRKLKNFSISISENYSNTRKAITPITDVQFFTVGSRSLDFFDPISEDTLLNSNFKFNGIDINTHSELRRVNFKLNDSSNIPTNIVEFDSIVNASSGDHELLILPRYSKNDPTIFNKLDKLYATSFQDKTNIHSSIELPSNQDYLLIFPYVSLPATPSRFSVSSADIYTSYLVNFDLVEDN